MEINIATLIQWALTSLASSGLVLFVTRKWIETRLEKQNKEFQNTLDTKLTKFNIQFSKLHQDRAEVIKALHKRLIDLRIALLRRSEFYRTGKNIDEWTGQFFGYDNEYQEELNQRCYEVKDEVLNYFQYNKIYFTKEFERKIDAVLNLLSDKQSEVENVLEAQLFKNDVTEEEQGGIVVAFSEELQTLVDELEDEFRTILGVE